MNVRKGKKVADWEDFRKLGISTLAEGELKMKVGALKKMMDKSKGGYLHKLLGIEGAIIEKGGEYYTAIENLSKFTLFKYHLSKGKSIKAAGRIVRKALFDYADIPAAVRVLRNLPFGAPFVTFTYKALPAMALTTMKAPQVVARYYKAMSAIEDMARGEKPLEEKALPRWIRESLYLRLPIKDKKGRSLYLDLNYILPWGDIGDLGARGLLSFFPSGPVYNLLVGLQQNRDPFTKRDLYAKEDLPEIKIRKVARFIYRNLAPSLDIPFFAGYSGEKLFDAFTKKPDRYGSVREMPTTLADVFLGLKTIPIDLPLERQKRLREKDARIREVRMLISQTRRSKELSNKEKRKRIEDYYERIRRIRAEY